MVQVMTPSASLIVIINIKSSGGPELRELFREIVRTLCAIEHLLSSAERV